MKILTIDVGGSHIKVLRNGEPKRRKIVSGPDFTPERLVQAVKDVTGDWPFEAVSIGYPGVVLQGRITVEPVHLAPGWVGFDFAAAFGVPTKIVNDAAMQALGSYLGGNMLFLGLGTGLGSAMIIEGQLAPMELGHLPYKHEKTFEEYVGQAGLDRNGKKKWRKHVADVVQRLAAALEPHEIVLGGGNSALLEELPENARLTTNAAAFVGGFRLWHDATKSGDDDRAGQRGREVPDQEDAADEDHERAAGQDVEPGARLATEVDSHRDQE